MEPINPQEPVSQDLMKQMESIKQMPPVAPVAPAVPQSVPSTGMNYAGFWRRWLASLIDSILFYAVTEILRSIFSMPYPENGNSVWYLAYINPFTPLGYIYNIVFIVWKGQTIGKMIMGIKVVTVNEDRVNLGQAVVRELFKIISSIPFLLGYLWMLWDKDKQTWHDKVAKTYVIKIK